ncbi:hypothetical protein D050_3299A, partial [Vibrio parahaemolyticus VPCR-2009]
MFFRKSLLSLSGREVAITVA